MATVNPAASQIAGTEGAESVQWVQRRLAWERRIEEVRTAAREPQPEDTPAARPQRPRRRQVPRHSTQPATGQMVFGVITFG